ncbi:MAG: hypothetical protein H7Z18_04620 [Methylophilaceae bacterium]|nr:hypothetical protein [Methylophilaceae bacterium]
MSKLACKKSQLFVAMIWLYSGAVCAEGVINITPYVSVNATHDDNVFRFNNSAQALNAFGSTATGDNIVSTELGVDANIRLSRQLIKLSANINDNQYKRFTLLNNVGNAYSVDWNWRLGNDFFGELGADQNVGISSFSENQNPVRNIRTNNRKFASANWQFHPDWVARVNGQTGQSDNSLVSFRSINNESTSLESGLRYSNTLGTQLGLAYRNTTTTYANRTGFSLVLFGKENTRKELIANAAWAPTAKTRISGSVSQVNLDYKNVPERAFSGLSERLNIDYAFSTKTSFNFSVYQELNAVEDTLSTYVQSKGVSFNPAWNPTEKVMVRAGISLEHRDYLGSSGLFISSGIKRVDEFKSANISLLYLPTLKSQVQLVYRKEQRTTNLPNADYHDNTVSAALRYNF